MSLPSSDRIVPETLDELCDYFPDCEGCNSRSCPHSEYYGSMDDLPELRTCGQCGHFDNCQMMCNLDFDSASEDEECRHGLESDEE